MSQTKTVVIKLGGAALDTELTIVAVRQTISRYRSLGHSVVLVHGGGPAINAELRLRGITWSFINGQRVTTPAMIDVIESTLCGQVNRRLVRQLGVGGIPVLGLAGTDQNMLFCTQASAELGLVGAIESVNAGWVKDLLKLENRPVPVIAPVGIGQNGVCYNINADWAAAHLAVALKVDQLIFLTDQTGVLDEDGDCIRQLDTEGILNMIACRVVSGGMLAKTQSVLYALNHGVPTVRILKASASPQATHDMQIGTHCVLSNASTAAAVEAEVEDSYATV